MSNRYIYASIIIVLILALTINYYSRKSYAHILTDYNYNLFYKDNSEALKDDIENYLNKINKYIFRNTNYEIYNNLSDNYEFVTNFAIDYISDNYEIFKNNIKTFENYTYKDKYNISKKTDKYVELETIYYITEKYFNVRDYKKNNKNIKEKNKYVSLSKYSNDEFNMKIINISTINNKNNVIAYVKFENNLEYKYTFGIYNNVLKINNLEVVE